jgi:hypothetical protein
VKKPKSKALAKQRAFLAAYCVSANFSKAADAAKVKRSSHYRWVKDDPGYPELFAEATVEMGHTLEAEAVRRAHEGVLEPVFYKGVPVGVIRVYSDSLMQTLLKGFLPEKYRDRGSLEVSGPAGGPIALADANLSALDDDELEQLIRVAKKLK